METKQFFKPFLIACLTFLFSLSSCNYLPPLTKQSYIRQFSAFIDEVGVKHEKYTAEDWIKADDKFNKYAETYFEKFKNKLDEQETASVNKLKGKYIGYKIQGKTGKALKEIMEAYEEILNQANGILESIRLELDSLQADNN